MAVITIRNLSEQTKAQLEIKAAQTGVSLEQFVRTALQEVADAPIKDNGNIMEIATTYFGQQNGIDLSLPSRKSKSHQFEL